VLLPKKADATEISDFRPISLIHSAAKIFSKLLANRLSGELNGLVSRAQSAFIKKRSIQDNFMYTQNLIKSLHRSKQPALFLKLDIAKAFDTVRWDFLMEVLVQFGFGPRWRGWITSLLSTSSSSILLNGIRGRWYKHYKGLRQGDPLSPMLFILAMEPLNRLLELATNEGFLTPINNRMARFRTSMYADDAAVFVNPVKDEIRVVAEILAIFGNASGLITNMDKCAVYPIRCDELNLEEIMEDFQCPIQNFPCKYLGLPLHYRQLHRVELQPLIDKISNRLPAWRGRFLNKAGRLRLLNSVLSSIPTYFFTVFPPKNWVVKRIDKIRRGFLWKGEEGANGGQCLVRWAVVKKPKKLGGLGVLDLERFSRALRLRWLWYRWVDPDRPWVGSEPPCNEEDSQLFRACTVVTVGNGCRAEFWGSSWLQGRAPRDIAPNLFKLAWRKHQSVRDDLQNNNWTRGLWRMTTTQEMTELIDLWSMIDCVQLSDQEDKIIWKWTENGYYSSKSAYQVQFLGSYCTFDTKSIWSAKTEDKHRFFAWLLIQCKILTADQLSARNWPCNPICQLCDQQPESAEHMVLWCAYAQEVWFLMSQWTKGIVKVPSRDVTMEDWWNRSLQGHQKKFKQQLASLLIYTAWNIWKERIRRIFEGVTALPSRVLTLIKEEIRLRCMACGGMSAFLFSNVRSS
jgi:mannosylglycoprotein endo-beta-mannosidase